MTASLLRETPGSSSPQREGGRVGVAAAEQLAEEARCYHQLPQAALCGYAAMQLQRPLLLSKELKK